MRARTSNDENASVSVGYPPGRWSLVDVQEVCMRFVTGVGLTFALIGFWNDWFRNTSRSMSGRYWYVFEASEIYVIAFAAAVILALLIVSARYNIGFELPVVGVLSVCVLLLQWLLIIKGIQGAGVGDLAWTEVGLQPAVYLMILGQAMMVWGSFAAWSNQNLRDFHEL